MGFTLIELLVVIAIISLLMSILLPSLKKARELTYGVICMSNLRQIGVAAAMYASDNQDMLPRHIEHKSTTPSYDARLLPYLDEQEAVFWCPAMGEPNPDAHLTRSYSINPYLPKNIDALSQPATEVFVMGYKAWNVIRDYGGNYAVGSLYLDSAYARRWQIHGTGCNFLFVAGNVDFHDYPMPYLDGTWFK